MGDNVSTSVVPSMSSDGSTVLVQPKDGKNNICAIDMKTGQQLWAVDRVRVENLCIMEKPLISPDASTVLVRTVDPGNLWTDKGYRLQSMIQALDMKNGQQQDGKAMDLLGPVCYWLRMMEEEEEEAVQVCEVCGSGDKNPGH